MVKVRIRIKPSTLGLNEKANKLQMTQLPFSRSRAEITQESRPMTPKLQFSRHLLEWVLEAQANKWSQRISALQMDTQLKIEGKNDIDRKSVV